MKKRTRVITLLLAAVLLLSVLSGCGKKPEGGDKPNNNKGGKTENTDTPAFVYLPDYIEPDGNLGRVDQCYPIGGKIYFTSAMPTGKVQELYPDDPEVNPWYFDIEDGVVNAGKIDYSVKPLVYDTAAVAEEAAVDVMPMPVPVMPAPDAPEAAEEDAAFEAEKQAAIEKYIQYDEDGKLITPEGYQYWDYDKTEQVLMRMNVDGTGVTRLENYALPEMGEGMESDGNLNTMMGDREGRLWVSEQMYAYSFDPDTGEYLDGGEQCILRQLDENGGELRRVSLDNVKEASGNEWFYVQTIALDGEDNAYILCDGTIYVIDLEGTVLFKLQSENWINSMMTLADGRVAAVMYEEDGQKLKTVDAAQKNWGDSYDAPSNMYNCMPGSGDYDLYFNDGMNLYGYSVKTGKSELLLNWLNADINGDYVRSIVPLEDGRVVVLLYNYGSGWEKNDTEMAVLSKKPYSALGNKTVLTLACLYDYEIRDRVIEFNKKNDSVRIEVKNYSIYNNYDSEDPADYNAGLTKLNTEIISGTVPDILMLEGLPAQQYMTKGLLEDLYPLLDSDSELSRDQLITSVLDNVSFNDKLYQTVSSFTVNTVLCPKSVVGNISGWTLAEMRKFQDQMPPESALFRDMTKANMLQTLLIYNGSEFIDWETGKCNFNSQGFIDLLEYCNTFPAEIDWEHYEYEYVPDLVRLQNGTMLGIQLYLSDFTEYLANKTMLGGDAVAVGFPSESRQGHLLQVNGGLAISSKCADKDAAWQFVRQDFLPKSDSDSYNVWGLPINRADMDRLVEQSMHKEYVKDENGVPVLQPLSSWWMDDGKEGTEIKIMPAEQADIDEIMAIIDAAKPVSAYDQDVDKLVGTEAEAYFSGQKNARDVANVIQSKMQTYVNEHM